MEGNKHSAWLNLPIVALQRERVKFKSLHSFSIVQQKTLSLYNNNHLIHSNLNGNNFWNGDRVFWVDGDK